jgi:hypothetical protein
MQGVRRASAGFRGSTRPAPLGGPGAHQRVELVDERITCPRSATSLSTDFSRPRTGLDTARRPERAQIEREDATDFNLRHVSAHDALREPFRDGRLPTPARRSGPDCSWCAGRGPDHAADLVVAPDDRIERALRAASVRSRVLGERRFPQDRSTPALPRRSGARDRRSSGSPRLAQDAPI